MIETDDNKSYEVFLGDAFLALAGVSGGYYFSHERKLGSGAINEALQTPRFVYVWLDGSAAFSPDLLSEFMKTYADKFSSEFQLTIDNFLCVVIPDEIIKKYGLNRLHSRDGQSPKECDVLVRIELKRKSHKEEVEAGTIKELFYEIKNSLRDSGCSDVPFAALSDKPNAAFAYDFVFFSTNTDKFKSLYGRINNSSFSKQWKIERPDPVKIQQSGNVHAYTYRFVAANNVIKD